MLYLRQSTASQAVLIGPFVDSTDGNTAETGLTIDAADIRLSKNGANIVGKNSGGGTHDELGYYTITLDATDTNTVGRLQLMVHMSGALPVYHEYQVLEEAVFDNLFASSAPGPLAANTTGSGLTAIPWNSSWDAEVQSECTDALNAYDPPTRAELTSDIGTVTSAIGALNDLSQADVRTAVGLASANLDTQLAALPTAAENADAVWDEDLTGHTTEDSAGEIVQNISGGAGATAQEVWEYATRTLTAIDEDSTTLDIDAAVRAAVGLSSANLDTQLTAIASDADDAHTAIDALVADIGSNGAGLTAIPWNSAWDAEVQSEVADALAVYDPPTHAELTSGLNGLPTAAQIRAEMDSNSTQLAAILEDTGTTIPATLSTIAGYIDTEVAAILVDTGTTLDGKLDTIDGIVDAIKAKTDSLTFTVAGQVDANIQYVNDTEVGGDGAPGTEWGPA